ncbi:MAG TPA: aminopeptidase [Haloplasmataceae bacterium]
MINEYIEKYAQIIVKIGLNVQKGQTVIIRTPIDCARFARCVAEYCYKQGAREVVMSWNDELTTKMKYLYADDAVFDEYPNWMKEFYNTYAYNGAAFLTIYASDPDIMKEVDPSRIVRQQKVSAKAIKDYQDRLMSNQNAWCIVSIPTESWAKKIFPNESSEKAIELLWENIYKAMRVDQKDPVLAWEKHLGNLKKSLDFLNQANFRLLKIKNSLGTDLTIELPENHVWLGGSEYTQDGIEFIANMPTEEVFTAPKKNGVNGIVYSSKPLSYNGKLIDKFSLTFKDGRIVDFSCEDGYETLKQLIDTDEGSHYLGEIALVPYDSPISKCNILFYNTLYDENASCHLAIGRAYPTCIKDGDKLDEEELERRGINNSINHEDFMFGTKDLEIIGVTFDNREVKVFENGNFAF